MVFLLWYKSLSSPSSVCMRVPALQLIVCSSASTDCSSTEYGDFYLSSEPTGRVFPRPAVSHELWGCHCCLLVVVGWTAFVADNGGIRRCPLLLFSLPGLSPIL